MNGNGYFFHPELVREFETKLDFLRKPKKFSFLVFSNPDKAIEADAIFHSCGMEIVGDSIARDVNRRIVHSHHGVSKVRKQCCKTMKRALAWGKANFNPSVLVPHFVKKLNYLVNPGDSSNECSLYRGEGSLGVDWQPQAVRPNGATFTPPSFDKIPIEMERFCSELKQILSANTNLSSLYAGIYAHLHIARIHPFVDGNGRTARTLQNIILSHKEIPHPVISTPERYAYFDGLDRAVTGWRERTGAADNYSKGETFFYNYLGGKVISSIDRCLE